MTKTIKDEFPTLTQLEKDVLLNGIVNSGFYHDDYDEVWSNCIIDTCKVTTKSQLSGVIASLIKKDLIEIADKTSLESCVRFTPEGLRIIEQIEL